MCVLSSGHGKLLRAVLALLQRLAAGIAEVFVGSRPVKIPGPSVVECGCGIHHSVPVGCLFYSAFTLKALMSTLPCPHDAPALSMFVSRLVS